MLFIRREKFRIFSVNQSAIPLLTENRMTTLTFADESSLRAVCEAVEQQRLTLGHSLERTRKKLQQFEQRYNVETAYFLDSMTAEDLQGGDMEYVEWAGEAQILALLEHDLKAHKNTLIVSSSHSYSLPRAHSQPHGKYTAPKPHSEHSR